MIIIMMKSQRTALSTRYLAALRTNLRKRRPGNSAKDTIVQAIVPFEFAKTK